MELDSSAADFNFLACTLSNLFKSPKTLAQMSDPVEMYGQSRVHEYRSRVLLGGSVLRVIRPWTEASTPVDKAVD